MQIHIYAATARCSIYCIYRPQYFPCRNIFRIFSISLGGIYSVFSLVFQYFHSWNIFSISSIFLCEIYSLFSVFSLVEYIHYIQYFHWWNIFSYFSIFICEIYSLFSLVEYIQLFQYFPWWNIFTQLLSSSACIGIRRRHPKWYFSRICNRK